MRQPLDERGDSPDAYTITHAQTGSGDVIDIYPFPAGIRPFALNPDHSQVYAQLSNAHAVVSYSLGQKTWSIASNCLSMRA